MGILLIGLNHRTAPVEVREQLAFSHDGAATALLLLRNRHPDAEAVIVSTCNRVEIIVASPSDQVGVNEIVSFIAQARDLPVQSFRTHLYTLAGEQAIRHLFRVCSGLDSMVLGENQIINQVRAAYALACEQGATGRLLNGLFNHAFAVAKRIRSETGIADRKLSMPSIAVDIARQVFSDFDDKQTLVVGAGEMAQLTCQYLRDSGAKNFTVTTRTLANAKVLADSCHGSAIPFGELDSALTAADIVIMATRCPVPFLTVERVKKAQLQRRQRPLFIIDLAVPRNVEPGVGELAQTYLYDVDAIGRIVEENKRFRLEQLGACEHILDEEIGEFEQWLTAHQARPLIVQLNADAVEVRKAELARFFKRCPDLADDQKQQIEQLLERVTNKLLHPCIHMVRQHTTSAPVHVLTESFHQLAARMQQA